MTIELVDVSKVYRKKGQRIQALKDIYLTIPDGKIFGLIGYSGAGKSTLLRTINLLETPSSGQVIVNGVDVTKLNKEQQSRITELLSLMQLSALNVRIQVFFRQLVQRISRLKCIPCQKGLICQGFVSVLQSATAR